MLITNKLGLPQPIVDAVKNDDYSRGASDISVTGLIAPPRLGALLATHWDALEEDASDRIFSLLGRIGHGIAEKVAVNDNTAVSELRLYASVGGWTISGQFDHCTLTPDGVLTDYKFTTVYKYGKDNSEWEAQLNAYWWLLKVNGIPAPSRLQVCAVFRDWSKMEAFRRIDDPTYPQRGVELLPFRLWPEMEIADWLEERVRLHQAARSGTLPRCTDEERWMKPGHWAIMRDGQKRAVKRFSTKDEAQAFALSKKLAVADLDGTFHWKSQYYLMERGPSFTRCSHYCPVRHHCDQWLNDGQNPESPLNELE